MQGRRTGKVQGKVQGKHTWSVMSTCHIRKVQGKHTWGVMPMKPKRYTASAREEMSHEYLPY